MLLRPPDCAWSERASAGGGYSTPTPLLDEVEAVSLRGLLPLVGLHAERAVTEALDAKWADAEWDVNGSELRFDRFALFVNAVNLLAVRQAHWDPLLRPSLGPGENPITDVWAPLVGRTYNKGLRTR